MSYVITYNGIFKSRSDLLGSYKAMKRYFCAVLA